MFVRQRHNQSNKKFNTPTAKIAHINHKEKIRTLEF